MRSTHIPRTSTHVYGLQHQTNFMDLQFSQVYLSIILAIAFPNFPTRIQALLSKMNLGKRYRNAPASFTNFNPYSQILVPAFTYYGTQVRSCLTLQFLTLCYSNHKTGHEMISATDTIKLLTRVTRVSEKLNNYRLFSTHRKSSLRAQYNEKDAEAKRRDLLARGLPKQKPIKGVKQILVVASGKGGVGKSTIAVNLSVALKILQPDKSVGLLDADVFGPSIPLMMNIHQSPTLNNNDLMEPLLNYGVKCMSMGFLIDEKSTVIWRGLMVMSAIQKLLYQVAWGPLDYLIIDTPPGTGDTHLSLLQNLPVTAALLVTTPQKAALEVTGRGASMFKKLNVPISGIVENMSTIVCPKCSNEMLPFGEGATVLAKELGVDILEKIPLSETIADCSDKGKPIVLSATESMQAMAFKNLAKSVTIFLDKLPMSGE